MHVRLFARLFVRLFYVSSEFSYSAGVALYRAQVMGEHGMLSLGNPPSSGLEFFDSTGCTTSPPEHSFPQRFREVQEHGSGPSVVPAEKHRVSAIVLTKSLGTDRVNQCVSVWST